MATVPTPAAPERGARRNEIPTVATSRTLTISRHADRPAVAVAAAAAVAHRLVRAIERRDQALLVVTGGGAGIATLMALRAHDEIDWHKVGVWFGDERHVPTGDPERNETQAREALFEHGAARSARIFPVPAPPYRSDTAAALYERDLPPYFDVHLLGVGDDGHVNSLFPHSPAIAEEHARVVAVVDSPKPPPLRVTLTFPAIASARHVMMLVAGADKAAAVAAATTPGAESADWPAAGAHGARSTTWFVDEAAAALL